VRGGARSEQILLHAGTEQSGKALIKAEQVASHSQTGAARGTARFEVTPSGVAIPKNPAELKANLGKLQGTSTNPASSRKFVGPDSQGPLRVRVEKAHPADPNFTGTADPLHTADHMHIDRRANVQTGPWSSSEKVPYDWPF
jgi:hypothetical protein